MDFDAFIRLYKEARSFTSRSIGARPSKTEKRSVPAVPVKTGTGKQIGWRRPGERPVFLGRLARHILRISISVVLTQPGAGR